MFGCIVKDGLHGKDVFNYAIGASDEAFLDAFMVMSMRLFDFR